jgi:hypothetical protein
VKEFPSWATHLCRGTLGCYGSEVLKFYKMKQKQFLMLTAVQLRLIGRDPEDP